MSRNTGRVTASNVAADMPVEVAVDVACVGRVVTAFDIVGSPCGGGGVWWVVVELGAAPGYAHPGVNWRVEPNEGKEMQNELPAQPVR